MSIENPTKINKFLVSYINDKSSEEYQEFIKIINDDDLLDLVDGKWLIGAETLQKLHALQNFKTSIRVEEAPVTISPDSIGQDLKLSLFPYQKEVVEYCLNKRKAIIVLPCGSGKTPIGLDTFIDARKFNLISPDATGLIVVKASLKIQWFKEVDKFSNLKASLLNTYNSIKPANRSKINKLKKQLEPYLKNASENASEILEIKNKINSLQFEIDEEFNSMFNKSKYDLFIANYETLRDKKVRDKLHKSGLEYIYADEIQAIKSPTSIRSKALCEFSDIKLRYGATATPIQKNPLDAFGICKFVSPSTFPTKSGFEGRYLIYSGYGRVSGSKNEKELNQRLSEFMIVKTKEEVSKQLPELVVTTRYCQLEPKQEDMTNKLLEEIKEFKDREAKLMARAGSSETNEELLKIQANILARQTFASELAVSEELLKESDSDLAKRYITGSKSNKIEMFLDMVEEITGSGEKVAVFSKYKRLQPILAKHIQDRFPDFKIAFVNGDLSAEQRYDEIYNKFRDNNEYKVLIMSGAANEGVNLSTCKYLIEMEPSDSYLEQTQRYGRLERADSIYNTVFVTKLIAEKSYDEIALKIIDKKEKYDSQIIKGNL